MHLNPILLPIFFIGLYKKCGSRCHCPSCYPYWLKRLLGPWSCPLFVTWVHLKIWSIPNENLDILDYIFTNWINISFHFFHFSLPIYTIYDHSTKVIFITCSISNNPSCFFSIQDMNESCIIAITHRKETGVPYLIARAKWHFKKTFSVVW